MIRARDIMTADVMSIAPERSVGEAIDMLLELGISGLPVVDAAGSLVGIVTEFALLAITYDQSVMTHPVAQHMTTNVITVDADAPISHVADLCIVHRVRRVPVVERGRLTGLISRRDVLRAVYEQVQELRVS